MIPFRVKLSPLDPFKWAVVLKNPELHWIPVSFLPLKQRSRYKYWSFLPLLIYYGTGQLRLFNVFQFQGRRVPALCRAWKFHPRLPRPDTSPDPWTTWTTLLLRVLFSGVHDAVMLLEGNAQCEHVVLNSVLVDAFRNCWVPKLWLRPGVSPRSMCQIHQFGDCLVISAIFFEIFPQGDAVAGWYFCWTKKESWFQFQPLVCDLLFLYREMIAVIHFVFCSSRSSHEEMSGLPQIKGKMVRSLCTRLKGKEGRLLLCRWTGRWAKEIYGVMDSHSPHYRVVDLSAGEVFFASPGKLPFFRLYPTRIVQHYAASSKRPSKHQKTIGGSTQIILNTQSSTKKNIHPPKKILKNASPSSFHLPKNRPSAEVSVATWAANAWTSQLEPWSRRIPTSAWRRWWSPSGWRNGWPSPRRRGERRTAMGLGFNGYINLGYIFMVYWLVYSL